MGSREPTAFPESHRALGAQHPMASPVNVLVTGFDVFAGTPGDNASYLIAKRLPPVLAVSHAHPTKVNVTAHPEPIEVSYRKVDQLSLLGPQGSPLINYGVVLHLGVREKDDDQRTYSLESHARRDGYTRHDIDGQLPSSETQPSHYKNGPSSIATNARLRDVLIRWSGETHGATVNISNDAGHYVCEYLYYSSLSSFKDINKSYIPWDQRTTVAFMHTPKMVDEASISKGVEVVIALIHALVDSRRARNGDYDDELEN